MEFDNLFYIATLIKWQSNIGWYAKNVSGDTDIGEKKIVNSPKF